MNERMNEINVNAADEVKKRKKIEEKRKTISFQNFSARNLYVHVNEHISFERQSHSLFLFDHYDILVLSHTQVIFVVNKRTNAHTDSITVTELIHPSQFNDLQKQINWSMEMIFVNEDDMPPSSLYATPSFRFRL